MFTRQKYLIGFLSATAGGCTRLQLDKGLFWLCKQRLNKDIYDFHPYLYGPFSETLYLDLRTLIAHGLIEEVGKIVRLNTTAEQNRTTIADIPAEDIYEIILVATQFAKLSFTSLLDTVYEAYPYFAINNQKYRERHLRHDPRLHPQNQQAAIFTIGYEGISIDAFLNRLIQNNIHVLVDVRNNPHSMKYGFSEQKLSDLCHKRRIDYLSLKTLGIASDKRQSLETSDDYSRLFAEFEATHMPKVGKELAQLRKLLENGRRIALMCFEKAIGCCHREIVGRHLHHFSEEKYELRDISTAKSQTTYHC